MNGVTVKVTPFFYAIGNSDGIPYYIKNIIALGAVVDGCQGNRASARECANGTFFFTPVGSAKAGQIFSCSYSHGIIKIRT